MSEVQRLEHCHRSPKRASRSAHRALAPLSWIVLRLRAKALWTAQSGDTGAILKEGPYDCAFFRTTSEPA